MQKLKILFASAAAAALVALAGPASAACDVQGSGRVDVITNFFPTLELLAKKMEECRRPDLQVEVKLMNEHKVEVPQAFGASSSPFDAAAVALEQRCKAPADA